MGARWLMCYLQRIISSTATSSYLFAIAAMLLRHRLMLLLLHAAIFCLITEVQAGIAAFHKLEKATHEDRCICGGLLEELGRWTEKMVGELQGMLRCFWRWHTDDYKQVHLRASSKIIRR